MSGAQATNAALKEWAIVCQALEDGRQTLLIRKGGIQEVKDGFEVTHRNFWLFPTYVHQKATDLAPTVHAEFKAIQAAGPPPGILPIRLYAEVQDVVRVGDLERLRHLADQHVLSWDCVAARFHYRNKPGVHLLVVRIYRRPEAFLLPQKTWYDGCVSWVDLDHTIDPDGCRPVLSDAEFALRAADIHAKASGSDSAT